MKFCGKYEYTQRTCPACRAENVKYSNHETTTKGWLSGREEDDPNKHQENADCLSCGLKFIRCWVPIKQNAWCISENVIIAGEVW